MFNKTIIKNKKKKQKKIKNKKPHSITHNKIKVKSYIR